ncbi:MAG TPA: hypothetical protein VF719_03745 [Abditibacteriaceae bacterium]|jgi:circadian clock protein KaiC
MRYMSINGQFRKMMVVIKMRRSSHRKDAREYETTPGGVIGTVERLTQPDNRRSRPVELWLYASP